METTETPTLISVREAARLASVSRQHVHRLIQRGTIGAVRVGDGNGPIRIPLEPFMRWLYGEHDESAA